MLDFRFDTRHHRRMFLMAILCVLVLAGFVAIWRWGGLELKKPWADEEEEPGPPRPREFFRRYLWYVTVTITAGVTSGLVMMGVGGRLAMRLLAATSSDSVQGRITEADEVVGKITLDGTIGLIVFFGLFGGLITGFIYILVRRWLPPGRWGGLAFGAILLIAFGSRIEPLRADNPDFDIVGPSWLAVVVFIGFGLAHGMLMASLAGRYSRALPLMSKQPRTIAKHAPLLLAAPAFFLLVPLSVGALLGLGFSRAEGIYPLLASQRALVVGRVVGLVLTAVALPHFVSAVVDIVGRA